MKYWFGYSNEWVKLVALKNATLQRETTYLSIYLYVCIHVYMYVCMYVVCMYVCMHLSI